jgi:hypothetical protein
MKFVLMNGMDHTTKFMNAQKARPVKNTKEDLFRTNAAIWLNKMCGTNHLTPRYKVVQI